LAASALALSTKAFASSAALARSSFRAAASAYCAKMQDKSTIGTTLDG
jgi:hypothetical protein